MGVTYLSRAARYDPPNRTIFPRSGLSSFHASENAEPSTTLAGKRSKALRPPAKAMRGYGSVLAGASGGFKHWARPLEATVAIASAKPYMRCPALSATDRTYDRTSPSSSGRTPGTAQQYGPAPPLMASNVT